MKLGWDEIQNQLQLFNSKTILGSQTSVDEASAELSKIIDLAASRSFKKKKVKDKKNKPPKMNQKWFDLNPKKMRTNLINYDKMFSKYPKDLYIRNHFYKLQREYNKTRKQTYREYKKSLLNQLETLHSDNPKLYWNLINELKE